MGPDDPLTLASRNDVALAYDKAGRVNDAIAILEPTLKLMEARLRPEHPDTLASRNNLAMAYQQVGRVDDAAAMHERTLRFLESTLGPEHPDTLTGRNNLAEIYRAAGRLPEVIAMHERTLGLMEARLAPGHPATLTVRNNLAGAYMQAGRRMRVWRCSMGRSGSWSPRWAPTIPTRSSAATTSPRPIRLAGRQPEVIAMHERTLRLMEAKLDPGHPLTLMSRHNLAAAYQRGGPGRGDRVARAEPQIHGGQAGTRQLRYADRPPQPRRGLSTGR